MEYTGKSIEMAIFLLVGTLAADISTGSSLSMRFYIMNNGAAILCLTCTDIFVGLSQTIK